MAVVRVRVRLAATSTVPSESESDSESDAASESEEPPPPMLFRSRLAALGAVPHREVVATRLKEGSAGLGVEASALRSPALLS